MYSVILLAALCGLVSLGVDLGRVQLAKTELRTAADAAARAAMAGFGTSVGQARADAIAIAASNTCDGSATALVPAEDIEFGAWDSASRTFTPAAAGSESSANAIRVTARRIAARGTAIPLTFARVVGRDTCDISSSAVAMRTGGAIPAFLSLDGITFHNNTFFGGYNPAITTMPTLASAISSATVGTNGVLEIHNNNIVRGQLFLGPAGSVDNHGTFTVTGGTTTLSSPFTAPALPAWSPSLNPGGIPQNYTVNANTTLAGGTYWFTSLTLNANLTFSGPATVHVNGNILMRGYELRAYQTVPANLSIYQHGTGRTFGDPGGNDAVITAHVLAPGADLLFNNKLTFRGSGVFRSMEVRNSSEFFYDGTATASAGNSGPIILVK